MMPINESARSLAWLRARLGLEPPPPPPPARNRPFAWLGFCAGKPKPTHPAPPSPVVRAWSALRERTRQGGVSNLIELQVWESDIWLCKTAVATQGFLMSAWRPPEAIDAWMGHPDPASISADWNARETAWAALDDIVRAQPPLSEDDARRRQVEGVRAVQALSQATALHHYQSRAAETVVFNQAIAWIDAAVGGVFKGVFLAAPTVPSDAVGQEREMRLAVARLQIAGLLRDRLIGLARLPTAVRINETLAQDQLIKMYNARYNEANGRFDFSMARVGQSELWGDRWTWLSEPASVADVRRVLAIAASVLASPDLVSELEAALNHPEQRAREIALCALRRLALTLRVMAWLEDALGRTWRRVRPEDLNCFAYNALKPEWPRRRVALSHRSRDVKPLLIATELWDSPLAAVDATYVPQWESNIGMVWGLFSATPAIVRIASEDYRASHWCSRESELFDHLAAKCDFLRGRLLIEASREQVGRLDDLLGERDSPSAISKAMQFPPVLELLEPPLVTEQQATLLAAAAAVRLIAGLAGGRAWIVDSIASMLRFGPPTDWPCPTTNPEGWEAYVELFERLHALAPYRERCSIRLKADYDAGMLARELDGMQRLPYVRDSGVSLRDGLVATEWLRVEHDAFLKDGRGLQMAFDFRDVTEEAWTSHPAFALRRGLSISRTSVPIWYIQRAGANIDRWPLVGDRRPILTQHADGQFQWMLRFGPASSWVAKYIAECGLEIAPDLAAVFAPQTQGGPAS